MGRGQVHRCAEYELCVRLWTVRNANQLVLPVFQEAWCAEGRVRDYLLHHRASGPLASCVSASVCLLVQCARPHN